jgi:ATP-dependent RNA helicase RhlE
MKSFHELGVSSAVAQALAERDIHAPFAIQTLALPSALEGQDVLAKAPTGSGKTIAFGVPIIERLNPTSKCPSAVVLVPTRELASQVAEELAPLARARQLTVTAVYGGVPITQQAKARDAHILIATPGRLQDLIERKLVNLDHVSILVLDEADRMLDMGFKPQVDRIVKRMPRDRQTMFFSATLDGEVGEIANLYTHDAARFSVETSAEEKGDVEHRFVAVTEDNKFDTLKGLIEEAHDLTLVFARTKRGADRLATRLAKTGLKVSALHGDMNQSQRERALDRFERGDLTVLVATDVAARGLDLDRITHVVNYDPPAESRDYTHRVGRTGRAGRTGVGVTLVLPEQQADVSRVAAMNGKREEFAATGMTVARPKLVYHGSRRGGKWGSSRPRRLI